MTFVDALTAVVGRDVDSVTLFDLGKVDALDQVTPAVQIGPSRQLPGGGPTIA